MTAIKHSHYQLVKMDAKIHTHITHVELTKSEPPKPSHSADISHLSFQKEAVKQPYFLAQNSIFILRILTLPVYVLT